MKNKVSRFSFRFILLSCFLVLLMLSAILLTADLPARADAKEMFSGSYALTEFPVYIDGFKVQAYFCDEKILISLDDLTRYGFELIYDSSDNSVNLRTLSDIEGSPEPVQIVTDEFKAQTCTLDTRVNGVKINAYALDGYTCVNVWSLSPMSIIYGGVGPIII